MAKLKFLAPLLMAGAAAAAVSTAPIAVADSFAAAKDSAGASSITIPLQDGNFGPDGGSGCTPDGTCGHGGPQGGGGCTASGVCGHGGPWGGGGCVPGVGCFEWGQ